MLQARSDVRPAVTELVVDTMGKVGDSEGLASEITALISYVQHTFVTRNVMRQRKQWDEDRQAKINTAIANAMRQWDDDHYPRLLEATWGWHPFYHSFLSNPLCFNFKSSYPLQHSVKEGVGVHGRLLQQSPVDIVYPVPWSVLFIRCFLKYHMRLPPLVSHPFRGGTVGNVTGWLKHAQEDEWDGGSAWFLATRYLKEEGFFVFAGAREVESRQ